MIIKTWWTACLTRLQQPALDSASPSKRNVGNVGRRGILTELALASPPLSFLRLKDILHVWNTRYMRQCNGDWLGTGLGRGWWLLLGRSSSRLLLLTLLLLALLLLLLLKKGLSLRRCDESWHMLTLDPEVWVENLWLREFSCDALEWLTCQARIPCSWRVPACARPFAAPEKQSQTGFATSFDTFWLA